MHILLNWLAQGTLVAVATATVLSTVPRSRTQARYWCLWAGYLAVMGLPLVSTLIAAVSEANLAPSPVMVEPAISVPMAWWTSSDTAIGLCLVWSTTYLFRLASGARAMARVRRYAFACPSSVQSRLPHWTRVRIAGRRARVILSDGVRTAAVLGVGSPVIAIAPALLEHLSDADLDRVVVHEWAHIQRRDDLGRFVQQCFHAAAGWHPALWWLGRQLDLEREVACDEMVVSITGGAKEYALCLTTVAAVPGTRIPALAIVSASALRRRLLRILAMRGGAPPRWRAAAVCSTATLMVAALIISRVNVVATAGLSIESASPAGAIEAVMPGFTPIAAPIAQPSRRVAAARAFSPVQLSGRRDPGSTLPVDELRHLDDRQGTSAPDGGHVVPEAPARLEPEVAALHAPHEALPSTAPAIASSELATAAADHMESAVGAGSLPQVESQSLTPWSALANGGVAVGRASQTAGVKTAAFFSRMGKSIARSF